MKIEIEYNGTFATCIITDFMRVNSDSGKYVLKTCPFRDADKMSQIMALDAFETIKQNYKRDLKKTARDSQVEKQKSKKDDRRAEN